MDLQLASPDGLDNDGDGIFDEEDEDLPPLNVSQGSEYMINSDDLMWNGGPANAADQLDDFFECMFIDVERWILHEPDFLHHQPDPSFVRRLLPGSPTFWTVSLLWAYEGVNRKLEPTNCSGPPVIIGDGDPQNLEGGPLGQADATPGERVTVWVEIHRESGCPRDGCELIMTAAHETGHTLGLEHAPVEENIEEGETFLVPVDPINDDGLMRWEKAAEYYSGQHYDVCAPPEVRDLPAFSPRFSPNNIVKVRAHFND
jgi:hypothetical protein